LTPIAKLFAFVFIAGALTLGANLAAAQTSQESAPGAGTGQLLAVGGGPKDFAFNPVAHVRDNRSWEYGPFINYGVGVGDRSSYKFLWGGFQLSKPLSPVVHAGIFSGQFEFGGNAMPLWQAYTPPAGLHSVIYNGNTIKVNYGGGTFRGVSLTPVILRWNFFTQSRRFQPWFQGAGGLVYTTHKFPPDQIVPKGVPGGTCVWNFTPQGGIGAHYFIRPTRSIDLGVNAVHISSASLGDRNPGVNASVQIQVGYTYWK